MGDVIPVFGPADRPDLVADFRRRYPQAVTRNRNFAGLPARRPTAAQALAVEPPLPVYANHLDDWPEPPSFMVGRGSMRCGPNYDSAPPRSTRWTIGLILLLAAPAIVAAFSAFLGR